MEIFPNIKQKATTHKIIRVCDGIYIQSDKMQEILDCINKRVAICYAKMDELNVIEKLAIEILQETEQLG
jgi:hypothetical protein